MYNNDKYKPLEHIEFSHEQIKLMDASHSLLEAMTASSVMDCKIPVLEGVTYRRDGWGANFYNGNNHQPLTYKDLASRATVSQIVESMNVQTERLRASRESALAAK